MSVVSDSEGSHHSLAAGEFVISLKCIETSQLFANKLIKICNYSVCIPDLFIL